jgi:nicotinate-nucleotide adenylyltransferase
MTTRRLGVLGGTFDPIHCGHLDVADAAESALGLTELWFVPSEMPPHRAQPAASSYHRFAMVALAVASHPRWRASDIELAAATPSFTSATLDRLHAAGYTPLELFFIVGADAFAEISAWKDFPSILNRAHFAVVSRTGLAAGEIPRRLPALAARMTAPPHAAGRQDPAIFLIDAMTADVSSSEVRRRLTERQSIAGLVPPAVARHIDQHNLYVSNPDASAEADAARARTGGTAGRSHGQK